MYAFKPLRMLQALLFGGFAMFGLSFSHLAFAQPAMMGMEGMSGHSSSSVQCQTICTTVIETDTQGIVSNLENDAKDPLPFAVFLGVITLSLLAVTFVVKRLHLLSSWRPPDRVLLSGHYADGL